jgi:hypothetical protein
LEEAFRVAHNIHSNPVKPATRSVIFQAAKDQVIPTRSLYEYACTAGNCSLVTLEGRHALHQEDDPIRHALEFAIDGFFTTGNVPELSAHCNGAYEVLLK